MMTFISPPTVAFSLFGGIENNKVDENTYIDQKKNFVKFVIEARSTSCREAARFPGLARVATDSKFYFLMTLLKIKINFLTLPPILK